ncbi:putative xylitol oxidase [Adhaeribacter aerolatus]|uniref:Putative xylitol oxidase n=1 Tax=Adhaeribacter aerolatus TaxID=670289 RepID=A0A512AY02_9BACT|nr:FAD-binding protein [Adhaeribacter aerolatus]GEO04591.1 putative xylitol oxidase [Adhaeribacter aerolatus]
MNNKPHQNLNATASAESILSSVSEEMSDYSILNWAGNITFSTNKIYFPQTVEEVQALVKQHARLKVLGSRHCFNRIADSSDVLLSTKELHKVVSLDSQAHTVTVEGGIKYGELAPYLAKNGYALPNLASLPHISVAGSIITATHGSGVNNGNLATPVIALEMILADGSVRAFSKENDGALFYGVVVNLGAIGVITKVTLALEPAFQMQQTVYENLPLTQLTENFREIVSAGYSVSLFTDWRHENFTEVWVKSKVADTQLNEAPKEFFDATAATENLHPIAGVPAENCTEQLGIPGAWYERLPHFKMGFTPSSGVELQSEYFVASHHAVEAIQAISRLGKQISPYLFVSEIRTIAADSLWLSPCYNQSTVAIHFTWKQDWPAVSQLLPLIEKELAPFNARPHWGKLFTMPASVLNSRYLKLSAFRKLVSELDPEGKFQNDFLNRIIHENTGGE